MYNITKTFTFCYGHRLYKDPGKCGHVHGHTARAEIVLKGEKLDDLGMIQNFDSVEESIGRWIEENLDHQMLLNSADPLVKVLKEAGEKLFILDCNPTAENIARKIYDEAKKKNLPVKAVIFWESPTASATYEG